MTCKYLGCSKLTSLYVGSGVTKIEDYAFNWCSSLSDLSICCSPTSIGKTIFSNCEEIKNVVFDCETIYSYLSNKTSVESITIKEGVVSIGDGAFSGCTGIASINIPAGVQIIGRNAFKNCSSLAAITIPNNVTQIGENAFSGTGWLNSFDDGLVYSDNWLLGIKGELPSGDISIVEGTKKIADAVFKGCTELTSVTVPLSVLSIGNSLFEGCTSLSTATIPSSVTLMGNKLFYGCTSLTTANIDFTGSALPDYTFYNCNSLVSFEIPDNISEIGVFCFSGCSSLSSIQLPGKLLQLGNHAFSGCSNLNSIVLPENIKSLGYKVFYGCTRLSSVVLPKNLNYLHESCFEGCTNLGPQLIIPDSVFYIGIQAFHGCKSLACVRMGAKVEMILQDAFTGTGLRELYIFGDTPPEDIRSSAFDKTRDSEVYLYVPNVAMPQYRTAFRTWNYFFVTAIKEMSVGIQTNDIYWSSFYSDEHEYVADDYTTVYTARLDETGQSLHLSEVEDKIIKRGEGVILKSTNIDFMIYYTSNTANESAFVQNDLKGVNEDSDVETLGGTIYTLKNDTDGLGFYRTVSGTLAAHSTFLSDDQISSIIFINKYKLTYIIDGEEYKNYEVEYGASITPEPAPTKEGYTFSGWSEIPEKMPAHDVVITGTFLPAGDANGDGKVDAADAVEIVNYILNNPSTAFNIAAADVDGDSVITIADAVAVVNIILQP